MPEDSLGSCLRQIQEKGANWEKEKRQKESSRMTVLSRASPPWGLTRDITECFECLVEQVRARILADQPVCSFSPFFCAWDLSAELSALGRGGLQVAWGCCLYLQRRTHPDLLTGEQT